LPSPVPQQARAFAPGSVGNIGVGFDLLGHSIDGPRDIATVRRIDAPVVRIRAISGDPVGVDTLPLEAARNTAGRALQALRDGLGLDHGFELDLHKGIALGSGLGGSAASCVAALVRANALLPAPPSRDPLYPFPPAGAPSNSFWRLLMVVRRWRRAMAASLFASINVVSARSSAVSVPAWGKRPARATRSNMRKDMC